MEASYLGRTDMVKELLQAGASRMTVSAPSGQTALMYGVASKGNNREIIGELLNTLKYGRTPMPGHEDAHGRSLFGVLFSAGGNIENFNKLMENGFGASIRDTQGNTVTMLAKKYGRIDVLELLLKGKQSLENSVNKDGKNLITIEYDEQVPEQVRKAIDEMISKKERRRAPLNPKQQIDALTAEKNQLKSQNDLLLDFIREKFGDAMQKEALEELRKHSPEKR